MINSIRKIKHVKECRATKAVQDSEWDTAWAYPVIEYAGKTSKKGRKNEIMWLKFICNSRNCKAELWVKNDDILEELPPT